MGPRKRIVLLIVVLVVFAGCAGPFGGSSGADSATVTRAPTGTEPPVDSPSTASVTTPSGRSAGTGTPTTESESTASATPRPTVDVSGGTLPVNATKVWRRFQRFRNVRTDWVPPVDVRSVDDATATTWRSPWVKYVQFAQLFGVGYYDPQPRPGNPGGSYSGKVVVIPNDGSAPEIEALLVHEFEHHAQSKGYSLSGLSKAIREGGAVFVADSYADRFGLRTDPAADARIRYLNATQGGERYWHGLYHFGYRHVEQRIDDPRNVSQVYRNPPETFEQLLHGKPPNEEPAKPLSVTGPAVADRSDYTYGELFLRVALSMEVSREDAARAASGWGNDKIVPLGGDREGFVWVIRMDDERNASQLRSTIARYFDAKPNVTKTGDGTWRMENVSDHLGDEEVEYLYQEWNTDVLTLHVGRIGEETVSLLVGPPETVEDLTVTGTDENVTVANRNESSTPA